MKYYKLDRDTKAYLKRMAVDGIKTPADIYSVNDFIVGLKDLNLWQNCSIFCFRSKMPLSVINLLWTHVLRHLMFLFVEGFSHAKRVWYYIINSILRLLIIIKYILGSYY
jgi:hypothetical protein